MFFAPEIYIERDKVVHGTITASSRGTRVPKDRLGGTLGRPPEGEDCGGGSGRRKKPMP